MVGKKKRSPNQFAAFLSKIGTLQGCKNACPDSQKFTWKFLEHESLKQIICVWLIVFARLLSQFLGMSKRISHSCMCSIHSQTEEKWISINHSTSSAKCTQMKVRKIAFRLNSVSIKLNLLSTSNRITWRLFVRFLSKCFKYKSTAPTG